MRARRAGTAWPQRGIVATAARRSQARLYRALLRAQPGPRQGDTPRPAVEVRGSSFGRYGHESARARGEGSPRALAVPRKTTASARGSERGQELVRRAVLAAVAVQR